VYCTLQINDLFYIGENPHETSAEDFAGKLFRLQTMSKGDYFFRQQYQTSLENDSAFAMRRITSLQKFSSIYKVKLSNLGEMIRFGE
jgi:hypothetical protein